MKKYITFFVVLLISTISMSCYIDLNEKKDYNSKQKNIAAAKTNEITVLNNELNYIKNKQIPFIDKYLDNISFDDKISLINSYISSNDLENAISSLNDLKSSITANINIIKSNFTNSLNKIITNANGLTDDYLEKQIDETKNLINIGDFDKIANKLSIISYKINNLLYANGQVSTIEPLILEDTIIANKNFGLPINYGDGLKQELIDAFNKMSEDAKKSGLNLYIASGYRDYYKQQQLFDSYTSTSGEEASRFSSPAGYSEHQTGLAIDIGGSNTSVWVTDDFYNTPEYEWLKDNCYKYGFIIRYPQNKEDITGYMFEPWHYRYVGTKLSTYLTEHNLTLEEYFDLD